MPLIPYAPLPEQEDVRYQPGPDSFPRPGVIAGRTRQSAIVDSEAYPGTARTVWIHVPAAAATVDPLACTVFADGGLYLDPEGLFRAGIVLDNLVASGAVPPMVGVFVDPGVLPAIADPDARKNRNREYDAPDARYADFLADEVLPRVRQRVPISDRPDRRALVGGSSGGNASFTAAWHRPDAFGRVVSLGASFAQMPGGNPYPDLIRTTPRKPLRVLLSAAHRDLGWNEPSDNWFAEILLVAAALAQAGYDLRLVLREGGHSMANGGALLPDALRWVWADAVDSNPRP